MPDLSRCRQIDGKLYCWDKSKRELVEIREYPVNSVEVLKEYFRTILEEDENGR